MPRQPDPQKVQARHDLIVMHLDIARTAIRGVVHRLHPEAGCLPLPDLDLPTLGTTHPDTAQPSLTAESGLFQDPYEAIAHDIFLNLSTPDGNHRNTQWTADHSGACSHMQHSSVRAVYELIHAWYGVISEARHYRDAESRRGTFEWGLGFVQYHLNKVADLPTGGSTSEPETTSTGPTGSTDAAPSDETDCAIDVETIQGVATEHRKHTDDEKTSEKRDRAACTCVHTCADDPAIACSLSGRWHVHPDNGLGAFGPCPTHPDAPGDL